VARLQPTNIPRPGDPPRPEEGLCGLRFEVGLLRPPKLYEAGMEEWCHRAIPEGRSTLTSYGLGGVLRLPPHLPDHPGEEILRILYQFSLFYMHLYYHFIL
jgi:hypothetical protein